MKIASVALLMLIACSLNSAQAADPTLGEKVFAKCRACHQVGETAKNGVGPELNGLVGRKAGSVTGYNYSAAFKALDRVWDEANFGIYIRAPQKDVPGTKMAFAGLKNDDDVANLTSYLRQFDPQGKKIQ